MPKPTRFDRKMRKQKVERRVAELKRRGLVPVDNKVLVEIIREIGGPLEPNGGHPKSGHEGVLLQWWTDPETLSAANVICQAQWASLGLRAGLIRSGRWSSQPNMQNMPRWKQEYGK